MEPNEVKIINTDEIAAIIEERGITLDDVREVIARAENTGEKYYHRDDESRFLARARLSNINCYTEYSPEADGFQVYAAFAHRVMLVVDDRE